MNSLVVPEQLHQRLVEQLTQGDQESAAILLASPAESGGVTSRLLVYEGFVASGSDYARRGPFEAVLAPEMVARLTKWAHKREARLVFVHTHPHDDRAPRFSQVDSAGERILVDFLRRRELPGLHAAWVLNRHGSAVRELGTEEPMRLVVVGRRLEGLDDGVSEELGSDKKYDRQVRAFGQEGQKALRALRIGIVGLGGTGSVIAAQLAHLGVDRVVMIDPDVVDESNLNRLVGATHKDVGCAKVDVAAREYRRAGSGAEVLAFQGNVVDAASTAKLLGVDLIFCCTDSHGSRAVLNQLAYQYFIPCIDMGVALVVREGRLTHIAGRVQLLAPGLPCLTCSNLLDADAVRRDLMSAEQLAADPYFLGSGPPQPAVISLNSTVASLAVTMLLGVVAGAPVEARYQLYDGKRGVLRAVTLSPDAWCVVCSLRGAFGKGDTWSLPVRRS